MLQDWKAFRIWPFLAPLVSIVAIPTVLATRELAAIHRPELYVDTLPTISKAAAFPPGSHVFTLGMTFAAACIVLLWPLMWIARRRHIRRLASAPRDRRRLELGAAAATLLGVTAGVFLGALAIISLEDNDPVHVLLSKCFFATQVLAFVLDVGVLARLHAIAAGAGTGRAPPRDGRFALTLIIVVSGAVFLVAFLIKGTGGFTDTMAMRHIYTASELLLAICCLLYPAASFREVRDHVRRRPGPDAQPGRAVAS